MGIDKVWKKFSCMQVLYMTMSYLWVNLQASVIVVSVFLRLKFIKKNPDSYLVDWLCSFCFVRDYLYQKTPVAF